MTRASADSVNRDRDHFIKRIPLRGQVEAELGHEANSKNMLLLGRTPRKGPTPNQQRYTLMQSVQVKKLLLQNTNTDSLLHVEIDTHIRDAEIS